MSLIKKAKARLAVMAFGLIVGCNSVNAASPVFQITTTGPVTYFIYTNELIEIYYTVKNIDTKPHSLFFNSPSYDVITEFNSEDACFYFRPGTGRLLAPGATCKLNLYVYGSYLERFVRLVGGPEMCVGSTTSVCSQPLLQYQLALYSRPGYKPET